MLDDDTLLPSVQFAAEQAPAALRPHDQAVLLGMCMDVRNSNPMHGFGRPARTYSRYTQTDVGGDAPLPRLRARPPAVLGAADGGPLCPIPFGEREISHSDSWAATASGLSSFICGQSRGFFPAS